MRSPKTFKQKIPKSLFLQVRKEMERRSELKNKKGATNYSSKYALSGITYCGKCEQIYRRLHWNNRGKKSIVWRCLGRLDKHKECDSRTTNEDDLKQAVLDGVNQVFGDQGEIKSILTSTLEKVLTQTSDDEIICIDLKLGELQVQLLDASRRNDDIVEIREQIVRLKEEKEKLLLNQGSNDNLKQRVPRQTHERKI